MQTQRSNPRIHELGVLDLLEDLELFGQGAGSQVNGQAALILQVLHRRLDPGRLSDTQAVFGTQYVVLQLLEGIDFGTFELGLQRLDPVLPDGIELLALGHRLLLLDEIDILLQTLLRLGRRVCGKGEDDIFTQFVRGLGADPLGHFFEQQPLAFRIGDLGLRGLGIQIALLHQELTLVIEAIEVVYKITVKRLLVEGDKG
ncbi:hypothetical protein D3C72_385840 [compost metagenome]